MSVVHGKRPPLSRRWSHYTPEEAKKQKTRPALRAGKRSGDSALQGGPHGGQGPGPPQGGNQDAGQNGARVRVGRVIGHNSTTLLSAPDWMSPAGVALPAKPSSNDVLSMVAQSLRRIFPHPHICVMDTLRVSTPRHAVDWGY